MLNQDKPQIIIPKSPSMNVTVEYNEKSKNIDQTIQNEKDELEKMKKLRDGTGFSLSKLLELKKKGYKIVKVDNGI